MDRESVVDYMLYDKEKHCGYLNVNVILSETLDSEHRLLIMVMRVKRARNGEVDQERKVVKPPSLELKIHLFFNF